ncbi:MAG: FG-GAP-like repeat-containing protein [Turneriella sp.]
MSSEAIPVRAYLCVRAMAALVLAGVLFFAGCRQFGDFAGEKSTTVDAQGGVSTNPNQVFSPTFAPPAGSYNATQNVAITSSTAGATVCYTTDGVTTPTCNASTGTCIVGTTYAATVAVSVSSTLMALACKAGMLNSTVSSAVYAIDSTPPTISLTAPGAGTYVTNAQVSYTTNEACNVASITWTQTGGTADPGSPRVQALTGSELTSGTHTAVTLANTPALVDGATYTLTFNCTDAAGNAATASSVTGVTFDGAVPVISAIAPANGAFMNTTQVSYTLSETCNTGNVTWTQTGGTADPGSPRVQAMSAAEKLAGAHNNITLASPPALVSGAVYSVSFNCTDFAGQAAATQTSTSVTFDNTLPVISAVAPAASSFVNNTQVSYTLSETCNTGAITWAQTGGTADVGAPHTKALMGAELNAGTHNSITITNNPTLVSGAIYTLTFTCIDAAGNSATPVTRTAVTYDNTGAVISAVAPASSAYVNNTQVSYTLSETCATASITWTRTAGTADPGSPRVQALTGTELNTGAHTAITLTNNPALVSGAVYTVQFDCTDAAANAATPVTVTNVTYDVTVPVISGVAPVASTFVNHQQVTYTLSETCATGGINWTWTGGTASSSFNQGLVAGELTAGVHGPFTISNNPALVSGAIYTVTFSCTDLAGNAATPITRTGVTFDNTPPTISIQNLRNNSPLHTGTVIGPATDNVSAATLVVEFNLDSTTWNAATYAAGAWKFGLPMGASTWRDRTVHTIQVRATDQAGNVTTAGPISVRKGNNRDINGDGYEDIVVSGWQDASATGKSYIFYGSAAGISNTTASSAPRIIAGEQSAAQFSRNSALADYNGDGFGDLAIGASWWTDGVSGTDGRIYIFYGSSGGISLTLASAANRIIQGVDFDNLGSTMIAADVNNDGYSDLLAGANGAQNTALTGQVGRVYLFYSSGSGISQTSSSAATVIFEGENVTPNSTFGSSIVAGDFDADGFTDVGIGAPAYTTNFGRAYMYYGTAGGFAPGTYVAATAKAIATGTTNTFLGGSMAAGDLNADGATDLAAGGYGATASISKLFLYYGAVASRPLQSNTGTPAATVTEGTNGFFLTTTIAIQDVNSDGYGDVIAGAHGGTANNGYTRIFFGQAATITASLPTHAGYSVFGELIGHQFGRGVGAADINGDGYPDLMVGANFFATISTVGNTGRAYLFHSSGTGPVISSAPGANRIIDGVAATEFSIGFNR